MTVRFHLVLVVMLLVATAGVIISGNAVSATPAASTDEVTVGPDESIQEAIDTAPSGATIELDEYTYTESVTVDRPNITLVGQDGTELDGSIAVAAPGVTIETLKIKNPSTAIETEDSPDSVSVHDVTVEGTSSTGISLVGGDITVTDVELTDIGASGVGVWDADTVTIEGVTVIDSSSSMVDVTASDEVSVSDVTGEDVFDNGVAVSAGEEAAVSVTDISAEEIDNEFLDRAYGVDISGGNEINVEDVEIEDVGGSGVRITEDDTQEEITITNIEIADASDDGISVTSGANVTIEQADILDPNDGGVVLRGERGNHIDVYDIYIEDTQDHGIFAPLGDDSTLSVTNAVIEEAGHYDTEAKDGIQILGGEHAELTGVDIHDPHTRGIAIESESQGKHSYDISDSTVTAASSNGIEVDDFEGAADLEVAIDNVQVLDNAATGINIQAHDITITDTTTEDNSASGMYVDGRDDASLVVEDSHMVGPDGNGINVDSVANMIVENVTAEFTGSAAIHVDSEQRQDRTLTVEDSTFIETNGGVMLYDVTGGQAATVDGIEVIDSTGSGVIANGETVTLADVEIDEPRGTAVDITATSEATVSLSGVDIDGGEDDGVIVQDGTDITITETTVQFVDGHTMEFLSGDVREQEIDIEDATIAGSIGHGVSVAGTDGTDVVSIRDTNVTEVLGYGYYLDNVEDVTLDGVDATDTGDGHLHLGVINEDQATIVDSFEDHEQADGDRWILIPDSEVIAVLVIIGLIAVGIHKLRRYGRDEEADDNDDREGE